HDEDRSAENHGDDEQSKTGHDEPRWRDERMEADPNHAARDQQRDEPPAPGIGRMPEQPHGDHAEPERHDELNGPEWNSVGERFAAFLFRLDELERSEAKKHRDARGKGAAENTREDLPAALEK